MTEPSQPPLWETMRKLADARGYLPDHPLYEHAKKMEDTTNAYWTGNCKVEKYVGTWARARRIYAEYSGSVWP